MYYADIINEAIDILKPKLLGTTTYRSIVLRLNKLLGDSSLKFKVERVRLSVNHYAIGGLYDMYLDKRYIIFYFSNKTDRIFLPEKKLNEFLFSLSQVIQHETIHACQWSTRDCDAPIERVDFKKLFYDTKKSEVEEYLLDPDEIDAYAHDIAMEIKFYYKNKNPYEILLNIDDAKKIFSYRYYKKAFKNNQQIWEKVKPKLLRKTYRWIPHAR